MQSWTFDAQGRADAVTYRYDPRSPRQCPVVETAHRGTQQLAELRWWSRPEPGRTTPEALDARSAESRAAQAEWIARAAARARTGDPSNGTGAGTAGTAPGAAYRAPFVWTGVLLVLAGGYAAWRARRSVR